MRSASGAIGELSLGILRRGRERKVLKRRKIQDEKQDRWQLLVVLVLIALVLSANIRR